MADTDALPYYPYRDDALLVHKAIKNYVKEIVNAYYGTDHTEFSLKKGTIIKYVY